MNIIIKNIIIFCQTTAQWEGNLSILKEKERNVFYWKCFVVFKFSSESSRGTKIYLHVFPLYLNWLFTVEQDALRPRAKHLVLCHGCNSTDSINSLHSSWAKLIRYMIHINSKSLGADQTGKIRRCNRIHYTNNFGIFGYTQLSDSYEKKSRIWYFLKILSTIIVNYEIHY